MVFKGDVSGYGKGVIRMIDFSNRRIEPLRAYDGANGQKRLQEKRSLL